MSPPNDWCKFRNGDDNYDADKYLAPVFAQGVDHNNPGAAENLGIDCL
jgi:hypothetical protein